MSIAARWRSHRHLRQPSQCRPTNRRAVATAGLPVPAPVASETADLKVELNPTGPCWVSATLDASRRSNAR